MTSGKNVIVLDEPRQRMVKPTEPGVWIANRGKC
jgi:hypothetical protein